MLMRCRLDIRRYFVMIMGSCFSFFQALPVLAETQQKCMNHIFGCKQTDLGKQLQAHLVHCVYEQVIHLVFF